MELRHKIGSRQLYHQGCRCSSCREANTLFHREYRAQNADKKPYYSTEERRQQNEGRKRPSAKNRESEIKKRYGVASELYYEQLAEQKGCCAICNKPEGELRRKLSIDHDHVSGAFRGLLCHKCNMGLGLFSDNITLLKHAITYLRSFSIVSDETKMEMVA